ncbi:MAG: restriction endonuclease subunit S [Sedimentisphaerales bacterium]|nr:restriction endonuclease subunit S [Sedimentisphaerales bacterium]
MKKGWQAKKLGELCEIELGKTPARENKAFWDEKRETSNVWLSIADLLTAEDNVVADSKEYLSNKGAEISKIVRKGTLLVSFKLTLGRLAFAGRDLFTNEAIAALTIRNETELSKEFLFYFLYFFDWVKAAENDVKLKGMTLNKAKLKEILVYFPSPEEQQRIVGILDEAFAGIAIAKANAEKNLQNARTIFDSHLNEVFSKKGEGWVEKRLGEIGTTQTGSTPKTSDQANYGDFISFVKPGDFNADGSLDYDKAGLSERGAKGARKVPAGSVLMVCIGATIGKCGYCDQDVATNQQVNALTPSDGSSNRFIYYQMLTEIFQRKVIHASGQATLPIINKSKWSALSVWLPPKVKEQKTISAKLDALAAETRRLEAIYRCKLAALEELKKSLLHQAFTGGL